jgi:Leucine-rich repeat (LRR) protein
MKLHQGRNIGSPVCKGGAIISLTESFAGFSIAKPKIVTKHLSESISHLKNYKHMKKTLFLVLFTFSLSLSWVQGFSQKEKAGEDSFSPEEIEAYKNQVTSLVEYLQGTMDFLGDPTSLAIEKKTVVNDSYLKIFLNDKVQIEDDLDEGREVPLYKDAQAYLKDVEFFFKSVDFKFVVTDINLFVSDDNQHFFRVTFNRILSGITVANDTVNSKKVRFMEVNLDVAQNDLKIASIYTTKLNEKEEIKTWWEALSPEWKKFFGKDINVNDSVSLSDVVFIGDSLLVIAVSYFEDEPDTTSGFEIELPGERMNTSNMVEEYDTLFTDPKPVYAKLNGILNLTEIDISRNEKILDLTPLSKLSSLEKINCSKMIISDLTPLRNLNRLRVLDCSETPVKDLSPLHYSSSITSLNCSYQLITDISAVAGLTNLEELDCSGNKITDLSIIQGLTSLTEVKCSGTRIQDLSFAIPLDQLENLDISGTLVDKLDALSTSDSLKYLNCDNTFINSIEPLSGLSNLTILHISQTGVSSLGPVNGHENLTKIYCDDTQIKKANTITFMKDNPGCLVIFESEELFNNWANMEQAWKDVIIKYANLTEEPSREELHALIKLENVTITGNRDITTLKPIRRLFNLKILDISSTNVTDFENISESIGLENLNVSNTSVENLQFAKNMNNLEKLNISKTKISDLSPLNPISSLELIFADSSGINDKSAFSYHAKNPSCIIVYKTEKLMAWWNALPENWKDIFSGKFKIDSPPTPIQLHTLIFMDSLDLSASDGIGNLEPLTMISGLKKLNFKSNKVVDLQPLAQLKSLEQLECAQNPVSDLIPVSSLSKLQLLDISNTAVIDLKAVTLLTDLKVLKCSGTKIKSLKGMENLTKLEEIELNNTLVKNLKPLISLPNLKSIKCFNSKISPKNIEKFKKSKPDCEVIYY